MEFCWFRTMSTKAKTKNRETKVILERTLTNDCFLTAPCCSSGWFSSVVWWFGECSRSVKGSVMVVFMVEGNGQVSR